MTTLGAKREEPELFSSVGVEVVRAATLLTSILGLGSFALVVAVVAFVCVPALVCLCIVSLCALAAGRVVNLFSPTTPLLDTTEGQPATGSPRLDSNNATQTTGTEITALVPLPVKFPVSIAPAQPALLNWRAFWIVMILGVCLPGWIWYQQLAQARFDSFLEGGEEVEFTSFIVTDAKRCTELNDPESLRYLTDAFRRASREGHKVGYSWRAKVGMKWGQWAECWVEVPEFAGSLTIVVSQGLLAENQTRYRIPLDEPIPRSLASLIARLIDS